MEGSPAARVGAGLAGVVRTGARAAATKIKSWVQSATETPAPEAESSPPAEAPDWARRLQRQQHIERGVTTAAHTLNQGDKGGSGASPSLTEED